MQIPNPPRFCGGYRLVTVSSRMDQGLERKASPPDGNVMVPVGRGA